MIPLDQARAEKNMAAPVSRVLVYGGKGALGGTCVSYFKAQNWVSFLHFTVAKL